MARARLFGHTRLYRGWRDSSFVSSREDERLNVNGSLDTLNYILVYFVFTTEYHYIQNNVNRYLELSHEKCEKTKNLNYVNLYYNIVGHSIRANSQMKLLFSYIRERKIDVKRN